MTLPCAHRNKPLISSECQANAWEARQDPQIRDAARRSAYPPAYDYTAKASTGGARHGMEVCDAARRSAVNK